MYEVWGRDACAICGFWSDHMYLVGSEVRNHKDEVISVYVRCGWSGCGATRERRRDKEWRDV